MKHVVLYVGHLYKPFWTKKIWPGWQGGSGKVNIWPRMGLAYVHFWLWSPLETLEQRGVLHMINIVFLVLNWHLNLEFWRRKKLYKLSKLGEGGGNLDIIHKNICRIPSLILSTWLCPTGGEPPLLTPPTDPPPLLPWALGFLINQLFSPGKWKEILGNMKKCMPPPHHWLHRYAACQVCHPWFQFFHNTHQSCPQCPRKLPTMPTHHQSCPDPLSLTTALPGSEKKIRADTATRTSKFVTTISHWFTLYVWLPSNTAWSYIILQKKSNHLIDRESKPLIRVAEVVRRHEGSSLLFWKFYALTYAI